EEYAYLAGTTKGQFYEQPYWNPPPTFLHEWTRSTFYLPSADAHSDTIVVFDRVNAENPKSLPGFDRYYQWDHDRITAAPALKQWLLHAQTRPTATGNGAAWTTAGGQQVRLTTLLPAGAKQTIVDEDAEWPDSYGYPVKSEQKWGIHLVPAQE